MRRLKKGTIIRESLSVYSDKTYKGIRLLIVKDTTADTFLPMTTLSVYEPVTWTLLLSKGSCNAPVKLLCELAWEALLCKKLPEVKQGLMTCKGYFPEYVTDKDKDKLEALILVRALEE